MRLDMLTSGVIHTLVRSLINGSGIDRHPKGRSPSPENCAKAQWIVLVTGVHESERWRHPLGTFSNPHHHVSAILEFLCSIRACCV